MLLFSFVGKRAKKPLPKFSIVAETTPPVTPPRDLDKRTNITIGDRVFEVEADDLETLGLLGQGAYGIVEKMKHKNTGTIMAVKVYFSFLIHYISLSHYLLFLENTCNC
jgi:mitogen-activated protein kinase kinase 3